MATTTLTVSNELLSAVGFAQVEEMRSSHHRPYKFFEHAMGPGHVDEEGGERIIVRWDTTLRHSKTKRHQSGYEQVSNQSLPVGTPGHDGWMMCSTPTYISLKDEQIARGKSKILDLWKGRVDNVELMQQLDFTRAGLIGAIASGTWAGVEGYEDLNSLNGADSATGFMEAASSGTNTIHNISRATYTATDHYMLHNLYKTVSDSASTLLNLQLYGLLPALRKRTGGQFTSAHVAYATLQALENLARANPSVAHYTSEGAVDSGKRTAFTYGGVEIFPEDLPSLGANTTANPWSFVFMNWKDAVKWHSQKGTNFDRRAVVDVPGTAGVRMQLSVTMGQLILHEPGTLALVDNAETWA